MIARTDRQELPSTPVDLVVGGLPINPYDGVYHASPVIRWPTPPLPAETTFKNNHMRRLQIDDCPMDIQKDSSNESSEHV
ncbi:hypothetical protein PROFUN_02706 [Planoprotostelium fungivorum]|uniref:Uncharacterized protein n=1 Tax=Planoprotostelium fungivorum TaxID=1890364 RepID=A0A2P6NVH9_9EUKA|nr:hypothetical protein PROFUN_02706 [Planoprotostelium fungivorum]